MVEMDAILVDLSNNQKLRRDAAVEKLQDALQQDKLQSGDVDKFEAAFSAQLLAEGQQQQPSWETKHGLLSAAAPLVTSNKLSAAFNDQLLECSKKLLSDPEGRVRIAAGKALAALCKLHGLPVFDTVNEHVINMIRCDLQRNETPLNEESGSVSPQPMQHEDEVVRKLVRSNSGDPEAAQLLHDTAGWRYLETSMHCLQYMADACGSQVLQRLDRGLFDLLLETTLHTNRFVRETAYYLLNAFLGHAPVSADHDPITSWMADVAECLARGLSDNWSQVRLAASVSTRSLIGTYSQPHNRTIYLPQIVPVMCLNRYYLAEGVRLYSQENWRRLTEGAEGVKLVETYLSQVCTFYVSQTQAENHAVREAACHCIAELGAKLQKEVLGAHIDELVETLILCFEDDSWPVRDATCLACGRLLSLLPDKAVATQQTLLPKFRQQLHDCIPSVRQGATESLAQVVAACDAWAEPVLQLLTQDLAAVSEQTDQSSAYGRLSPGPATYGVAKRLHDNDAAMHTDQTMYSCGSLAPKMGRGKKADGCTAGTFRRDAHPWEKTDGCHIIHLADIGAMQLYAQLVHVSTGQWWPKLQPQFASLVAACQHRGYVHHVNLLATFARQIIIITGSLNKIKFKPVLQSCLEPLFYCLSVESELSRAAAEDALQHLAKLFGPNIIRGRVEMMDNSLDCLAVYDRLVQSQQAM